MIVFNWTLLLVPLVLGLSLYAIYKYRKYRYPILYATIAFIIILSTINVNILNSQNQVKKENAFTTQRFESEITIPKENTNEFNYTDNFNKIKSNFESEQKRIENEAAKRD